MKPNLWLRIKSFLARPEASDCLFLLGLLLISSLPYIFGLGFYSDTWDYQGLLKSSTAHGPIAMFRTLVTNDLDMRIRPVQVIFLVLSYKMFGQHPLPYHVVSTAMLGVVVVFLYLTSRELGAVRRVAFAIALVFGLLPHYSTDRFWIASQDALLCMIFALAGILVLLKWSRPGQRYSIGMVALTSMLLVLSILSYEVSLGFIVAALALVCWRFYRRSAASTWKTRTWMIGVAVPIAALVLVGLIKTSMQTEYVYHKHWFRHMGEFIWNVIVQAVRFNLWTYCLNVFHVLESLAQHAALSPIGLVTAAAIAILTAAYLWRKMEPSTLLGARASIRLAMLGFILFALGFALFSVNMSADFSTPGMDNRVAIAAALGAACIEVTMLCLVCSFLPSDSFRVRFFSLVVGLICGINSLVVSGLGYFWADAASQQSIVFKLVAQNKNSLPKGSTLLLDGFCPFSGPAWVFEAYDDESEAIRLTTGIPEFNGDYIGRKARFTETAVETSQYAEPQRYPYGDHLFVYNVRHRSLVQLTSQDAAHAYLEKENPTGDSGCPVGEDGTGVKIF